MKASELFFRIRRDLGGVSGYIAQVEDTPRARTRDPPGTLTYLGDYNYTTCAEILNRDGITPDFEIDPGTVEEFSHALDRYLTRMLPGKRI